MIDKNGKLFGKINLIDLLIIIVILAVAAFVALRVTGVVGGSGGGNTTPVRISFEGSEVPDYVIDYIHEGESVMDFNEEVTMGVVESFTTGEPISYEIAADGQVQPIRKEGHVSLDLKITADAVMGEHGATIGGELYGVGHTLVIFAGQAKLYLKISGIEPLARGGPVL